MNSLRHKISDKSLCDKAAWVESIVITAKFNVLRGRIDTTQYRVGFVIFKRCFYLKTLKFFICTEIIDKPMFLGTNKHSHSSPKSGLHRKTKDN